MASNPTATLYARYKKDTHTVAAWLDKTSKSYGFAGSRCAKGLKKGCVISVSDFEPMADFLNTKGFSTPSRIMSPLSRAIEYRTTYGEDLQARRKSTTFHDQVADKNHLFFIDVLKRFHTILSCDRTPETLEKSSNAVGMGACQPQHATVEDAEDAEDTVSLPITEATPNSSGVEDAAASSQEDDDDKNDKDVTFEPWKEDEEEALFRWKLFMIEVQSIRQQISQLWKSYREGGQGLAGVALAHNVSIHRVGQLEEDASPIFKKAEGYIKLLNSQFMWKYIESAASKEETEARVARLHTENGIAIEPTTESIIDGFEIAEEEMLFAATVLIREMEVWRSGETLESHDPESATFVPRHDQQNMTALERYNQEKTFASHVIHNVQIFLTFLKSFGTFTYIRDSFEERFPWLPPDVPKKRSRRVPPCDENLSFSAVFAVQLQLDSIHALGTGIDRPCEELQRTSTLLLKSVKGLHAFFGGPGSVAVGNLTNSSTFAEELEWLSSFWQERQPETPHAFPEKIASLLRFNPALCGWWLHTMLVLFYNYSTRIANWSGIPSICARLYHAFVQEGSAPPNSGYYVQNLLISGGGLITGRAKDSRLPYIPIQRENLRTLSIRAVVSSKFFYGAYRKIGWLTKDELERLMTGTTLRWYDGKPVRQCFHHDLLVKCKEDKKPMVENPFLRVAQVIDSEMLKQSFDGLTLYRACWMVLQGLNKSTRPIVEATGSTWWFAEGAEACFVAREEGTAIAEILKNLLKAFGGVVHTSTRIDWAEELKCTCDEIPS
ncbi:hypothetical protein F5Y16DRAFT_414848 [Xylariaceae sp. FL0255]|nr:hypothetical protein F5Y16DRAFT_414848 [Xylariaceae sp. FL0255]